MEMITSHFGCGILEDVAFNMGEGVLGGSLMDSNL